MKLVAELLDTEAVAGVMASAVNAGAVTVSAAPAEVMPLIEAVIVVAPCARVLAVPLAFRVATAVLLDVQVTEPETLPLLPFE